MRSVRSPFSSSLTCCRTQYAELLGDMYTQTLHAVNEHGSHSYVRLSNIMDRSRLISTSIPADLPLDTRRRLIQSLERWHFEPHKLRDDEVLSCALILFEGLFRIEGMEEATGVTMSTSCSPSSPQHESHMLSRATIAFCLPSSSDIQTREFVSQF